MQTISHQDLPPADQRRELDRQIAEQRFLLTQAEAKIAQWTQIRDRVCADIRALEREKARVKG